MFVVAYIAVQLLAHVAVISFFPVIPMMLAEINVIAWYRFPKEFNRANYPFKTKPFDVWSSPLAPFARWQWRLLCVELILFFVCIPALFFTATSLRDRAGDAWSIGLFAKP